MKKVFNLINNNFVLITPLILYSLFSSIYVATSMNSKIINVIFALFMLLLMTAAFVAGWFKIVKMVVEGDLEDANSLLIKQFPAGVGEYFLPSVVVLINMFLLIILFLFLSYKIGMIFIGNPGIPVETFVKMMETPESIKIFVDTLTPDQLIKLSSWNMLIFGFSTFAYFLQMLYLPAMFFKSKNPYISFFIGLRDLFSKKVFINLGIFLLILSINIIITLLSSIFVANILIHFIITLFNFYFVAAVAVGVFYYYYENFVKPQIGQNIDVKI